MRSLLGKARRSLKSTLRRYLLGESDYPPDLTPAECEMIAAVRPFAMTTIERVAALIHAVDYIVRNRIPGAIVECGVFRGGSMMAAAAALLRHGDTDRDLYLYDTYEGMSAPTTRDRDYLGRSADELLQQYPREGAAMWCYATLDDVRQNLWSTGYPPERIHFIQGRVETTVPERAPSEIALLRLDTDWYESTLHELVHLYPRLASGGVLIIDDYGHWQGSRQATDEYFANNNTGIYLHRIDYTGRLVIKPGMH